MLNQFMQKPQKILHVPLKRTYQGVKVGALTHQVEVG
jgi:hypothetical protein